MSTMSEQNPPLFIFEFEVRNYSKVKLLRRRVSIEGISPYVERVKVGKKELVPFLIPLLLTSSPSEIQNFCNNVFEVCFYFLAFTLGLWLLSVWFTNKLIEH